MQPKDWHFPDQWLQPLQLLSPFVNFNFATVQWRFLVAGIHMMGILSLTWTCNMMWDMTDMMTSWRHRATHIAQGQGDSFCPLKSHASFVYFCWVPLQSNQPVLNHVRLPVPEFPNGISRSPFLESFRWATSRRSRIHWWSLEFWWIGCFVLKQKKKQLTGTERAF